MAVNVIKLSLCSIAVDEEATENEVRSACPRFFKPHGKRETYTMYRGFLIVRGTDIHASNAPVRRTGVWAFGKYDDNPKGTLDTYSVSAGSNLTGIRDAKRLVDSIIESKTYTYGMKHLEDSHA